MSQTTHTTQSTPRFVGLPGSIQFLKEQVARISKESNTIGAIGIGSAIAAGELAVTHNVFQGNPMAIAAADLFMAGTDFVYPLHNIMAPGYKVSSATPTAILSFWVAAGILTGDAVLAVLLATLNT